jgi:alkylation response protein AidB-like acyl-CoA dehydrogenase
MDFRLTADEEAFRQELRGFLRDALPADWEPRGMYEEAGAGGDEERWELERKFVRKLAERKWLAIAWPEEYGGLGASHMQQLIYNEEMAYWDAPGTIDMGVLWVGPAVMLYGSDEQKERFLSRIAHGEDVWCTLYSEPGAGSDLASLQTKAVRDGDDFVISGQKIWTSYADRAQWGWLAARTDAEAPKHKGISTFVLPMDTPGITVRPLVNLAGQADFNEVFFDNVRVPKEYLVGEVNRGWYHVAVALDYERSGIQFYARIRRTLERFGERMRDGHRQMRRDVMARHALVERWIELHVGTWLSYRIPTMQAQGIVPTYEANISKLFGSELMQRVAGTGAQLFGLHGQLRPASAGVPMNGQIERDYLGSVAATIGGGTSEVIRNVIAIRGLGLPAS